MVSARLLPFSSRSLSRQVVFLGKKNSSPPNERREEKIENFPMAESTSQWKYQYPATAAVCIALPRMFEAMTIPHLFSVNVFGNWSQIARSIPSDFAKVKGNKGFFCLPPETRDRSGAPTPMQCSSPHYVLIDTPSLFFNRQDPAKDWLWLYLRRLIAWLRWI